MPKGDAALRSAIVRIAEYYLKMAQGKSPAEMEALIWSHDSIDGIDQGESCAAFASLTLALAAHAVGQHNWVTEGTPYSWPLHDWADVRVDPNPDSLNIISVLQDAQAHDRWHPLGDGYQPRPGDWVLFDGHVEVITKYAGRVLCTIGGDSLPNFSVSAHEYNHPLNAQGVLGFVNNGDLIIATSRAATGHASPPAAAGAQCAQAGPGLAAIPGMPARPSAAGARPTQAAPGWAAIPGIPAAGATVPASRALDHSALPHPAVTQQAATPGPAAFPQAPRTVSDGQARSRRVPGVSYRRHHPVPAATSVPRTSAQEAFIHEVVPGAIAAQHRYGVPASVTIAQAIEESGWGTNTLAVRDNNLFRIEGTGPAGTDVLPTQEYRNGQWVTIDAEFRVYHTVAESIADHSRLLATSGYYTRAMADRHIPDAFANDLTGTYATDPNYGANLIALMRLYNLYQYDIAVPPLAPPHIAFPPHAAPHTATQAGAKPAGGAAQSGRHQPRRGQNHTPDNVQSRPQPAQSADEDWEQFALTMFGIPIIVNLFSSAVYELLRKPSRRQRSAKFKFSVTGYDRSIVEVFLPDGGTASQKVIRMFLRLAGPGQLYKWDDGTRDWKLLYTIISMR
jgi:flagellum-specific peptidoglycan hydrolase FlgJ